MGTFNSPPQEVSCTSVTQLQELSSQVFSHSSEYGDFDFQIADIKHPIWNGPHKSGGKIAFYRGKITGSPSANILVYLYVLYFQDSAGSVRESFVGYKIYPMSMVSEHMFQDLMNVIDTQVINSTLDNLHEYEESYGHKLNLQ